MLAALRSGNPAVTLDVVTQTDDQEKAVLEAIRKVIGPKGSLRGYHEAFGTNRRNHPHARYLLISPVEQDQAPFGWQMDNSPLDGALPEGAPAAPTTGLRWRDFSAVRLRREEVPADLARWFTGGAL
jgi:hypothetical protein